MTRKGLYQTQQHQVKQLIFECSLAKMTSFQTRLVLKDKLQVDITTGWINKIKAQFKEDARKEYYRLLTDNFAYKYLTIEVMQQMHQIIRQQWDIATAHKGKDDLIVLKALSEVRESVLRVSDFYKCLPEVEKNHFVLQVNHKNNSNSMIIGSGSGGSSYTGNDPFDIKNIENELSEEDKELLSKGAMIVGRDNTTGELIIDEHPDDLDFDDSNFINNEKGAF